MWVQSIGTPVRRSNGGTARGHRHARLRAPALIVLTVLLVISFGCRRTGPIPWPGLEGDTQAAGAGIEMRARFLPGRGEIEQLFKWYMPDSGIVPVQVSLRNNDVVPLTVNCWSDIVRDESFKGFTLLIDGEEVLPLHPIGVLQRMIGTEKHIAYSRSQSKKIVAGTFLPPLGGYFLYRELKVGRFYRPLFEHSFHESLPSGLLVPRTLEPGETARGYLYFALRDDANPYLGTGVDSSAAEPITLHRRYELLLESYRALSFTDSLPVYDAVFPRCDVSGAQCGAGVTAREEGGGRPGDAFVLALHERNAGTDDVLFGFGRVDRLAGPFDESFRVIAPLSGTHARIAGAAVRGSLVACALNFTGKSRLYLFDAADGSPRPGRNVLLPRRTRNLYLSGDLVLVVTDDEFCRAFSLEGLEERRIARLGHAVKAVTLCGDRLVVFDGMRGVCVYGTAGGTLLQEIERYPLPKCGDLDIATCDPESGAMAVLHHGSRGAGDTLVVTGIDADAGLIERARLPLPASIVAYHGRGLDLVLQLDGGLIVRLDLAAVAGDDSNGGAGGIDLLREAAFVPVTMLVMTMEGSGLVGIGEGGVLVRGALSDFAPMSPAARVSRSRVTVLEKPPVE
ncbi:MAG TPA: hypothetical protein VMX58_07035 [Patescibacteria group bacterium]|nr:hypothetical protein [Patescibacteria group bacterium]